MSKSLKALILSLACTFAISANAQGWKGIVPLHSTRADVERLLGPGTDECKCYYETEGEHLRVVYAENPCEGYPSGWNVPADTVLTISVISKQKPLFSEFHLDESKYEKASDHTSTTYYASRDEGIQYIVSYEGVNNTVERVISSVNYVPSSKDSLLRCPCFPSEDESIFRTLPSYNFSYQSLGDALARIDVFSIDLMQVPEWTGYIIVYAKKQTSPARAKRYARSFGKYLVERRNVPAERFITMYGGYKDDLTVELYLFPPNISPPKPRPTYVPCRGSRKV
ncbi:MAG: hypothetical protein M3447_11640 [Acidobacteriota bacterium]|nr:hypothetical protein [Acidobacteriota bacterium]